MTNNKKRRTERRKKWKKHEKILKQQKDSGDYKGYTLPKEFMSLKKYEYRKSRKVGKKPNKKKPNIINLPDMFDFGNNIEKVVQTTSDIENYVSNPLIAMLNFSINITNTQRMSLAGVLYLVGQMSKMIYAKYKISKKTLYYNGDAPRSMDEKTKFLLSKIGYWEHFGVSTPYELDDDTKDNYFLKIITDNKRSTKSVETLRIFFEKHTNFFGDNYNLIYRFDDAIQESLANSVEHAYGDNYNKRGIETGKWWLCGHYDKEDNSIILVAYDYGMGIRKSVTRHLNEEADLGLKDRFGNFVKSDAKIIKMGVDRDLAKYKQYKEGGRGQGLKKFKEFAIEAGYDCELTIVSAKGKYNFKYNVVKQKQEDNLTTLSNPIDGTLIKWKLKLVGEQGV